MIVIPFVFSHDNIFQSVKQESSHLAERRFDEQGNTLFEQLVFDEEYLIKYREVFFEARAEIIKVVAAYTKDISFETRYFEERYFDRDRDFYLTITMLDDYNKSVTQAVDIKIKQFLVAYIMYRWLETKLPNEASIYQLRAQTQLEDLRTLLSMRTKVLRRPHRLF